MHRQLLLLQIPTNAICAIKQPIHNISAVQSETDENAKYKRAIIQVNSLQPENSLTSRARSEQSAMHKCKLLIFGLQLSCKVLISLDIT